MLRAEIGIGADQLRDRIATVKQRAEQPKPLLDGPGPATAEEKANGAISTISRGSTSADYLTPRIARDRPDILERMRAGAYRSVRQAELEAGIIKRTVTVLLEPAAIARMPLRCTPAPATDGRSIGADVVPLIEAARHTRRSSSSRRSTAQSSACAPTSPHETQKRPSVPGHHGRRPR